MELCPEVPACVCVLVCHAWAVVTSDTNVQESSTFPNPKSCQGHSLTAADLHDNRHDNAAEQMLRNGVKARIEQGSNWSGRSGEHEL